MGIIAIAPLNGTRAKMPPEPVAVYCAHCDSVYNYYPEIPEHCWNCGRKFAEEESVRSHS